MKIDLDTGLVDISAESLECILDEYFAETGLLFDFGELPSIRGKLLPKTISSLSVDSTDCISNITS